MRWSIEWHTFRCASGRRSFLKIGASSLKKILLILLALLSLSLPAWAEQTTQNPAWAQLDAVKNDRVVTLDSQLFQYKPNAQWDQAYQVLFDALYGE